MRRSTTVGGGRGGSVPGLRSERPTTKGSETRKRIIAAATELFAEKGYHATSISDIGEHAGVQRGALYYHIQSKEDLLFEVLRGHAAEMLEESARIAAEARPPERKLRDLLEYHAASLLDRQAEMTIYERDRRALSGALSGDLRALQDRIEAIWARIVAEGVEAKVFRRVDPVVLKGIIAMVTGVHRWYRPGGRLTSKQINDRLADFVFRGLAAKAR